MSEGAAKEITFEFSAPVESSDGLDFLAPGGLRRRTETPPAMLGARSREREDRRWWRLLLLGFLAYGASGTSIAGVLAVPLLFCDH